MVLPDISFNIFFAWFAFLGLPIIFLPNRTTVSAPIIYPDLTLFATASAFMRAFIIATCSGCRGQACLPHTISVALLGITLCFRSEEASISCLLLELDANIIFIDN